MSFQNLGLDSAILQALQQLFYTEATPIQAKTIPLVLAEHDVLASAQTGTGKTASFALPILHQLMASSKASTKQAKALILAPTRELALQIFDNFTKYSQFLQLRIAVVYGGVKLNPQITNLQAGVEVLIATPGRLLDLMGQKAIGFEELQYLVLDEADRMLDMGFIHDIRRILQVLPRKRQTLLFSATFSPAIKALAQKFMHMPKEVNVSPANQTAVTISHLIHPVDKAKKTALLSHLIRQQRWEQALIFVKTKHGANRLVKKLAEDGITAMAIHGNKTQAQRVKALDCFKQGKASFLIATDIAARGIDIAALPMVVNYDLPQVAEDYVHRIGRTGRAGKPGQAISLVSADEFLCLKQIEQITKKRIARQDVDGFEPNHLLPSSQNPNAIKAKVMRKKVKKF